MRAREMFGERRDLRAGADAIGGGERQAACQRVKTCEDCGTQHRAVAAVRSPLTAEYGTAQSFAERSLR